MSDDQTFSDLLPAYAAGALDADELAEFERLLAEGGEQRARELAEWNAVSEQLAQDAEPIAISGSLRADFFEALDVETQGTVSLTPKRKESAAETATDIAPANDSRLPLVLVASLFVAALGWGLWTQSQLRNLRAESARQIEGLELALARSESELVISQQEVERARAANRIVGASGVRTVSLGATSEGQALSARSYVDPETGRAVVFARNLPDVGTDQTYQLWFLRGGAPYSAGVFAAEEGQATVLVDELKEVEGIQGWAVSIEPQGGSEQPTGLIVLSS
ncbi:MAG: anti-sigma factor [Acidobacteriota bacterium]